MVKSAVLKRIVWWCVAIVGSSGLLGCVARLPSKGVPKPGTYKKKMAIKVGGQRRSYLIHLPKGYDHGKASPLVVVIHGAFSTAAEIEKQSGFSVLADHEGFIALYPNGIGLFGFLQHWNSGHCCGKALRENVNDVDFIVDVIEDVRRRFNVDRSRIYMVGNSNGGMLTHRFAAERSAILAAIAPVAATIGGTPEEGQPEWRIPQPALPVPVIAFHGRADDLVLYEGGRNKRGRRPMSWISVPESMAVWVKNNGLESRSVSKRLRQGRVLRQTWKGDGSNTEVVLYTIEQWGHTWPGHYFTDRLAANDALQGFDATELIWEFFKRFQRRQSEGEPGEVR